MSYKEVKMYLSETKKSNDSELKKSGIKKRAFKASDRINAFSIDLKKGVEAERKKKSFGSKAGKLAKQQQQKGGSWF